MSRLFALIIGLVFLVAGVLGYIPGITTSGGMLLGIFEVDAIHNIVHLAVGILGIGAWYWERWSRLYCQVLGVFYLIVGILGFVPALMTADGLLLGLFHVNAADNVLHLVVGAVAAYAGFVPQAAGRRASPTH